MGYQVLARKWRPGKFSELVGQEHVVKAISNALDNNRLHHAYLFTGTRGVGKTTIARIFARSLNCETGMTSNPCGVCSSCLDIEQGNYVDLIEIDAASRTKVEDTREILDNVQYRPTRGQYKVYLIDEVHMLSKHSFNALLKTLEEPPPHIKFLLATTDPQKLPITILSRCLQFNLKALTREQIGGQLNHILSAENIPFETQALQLLARSAQGSMRDALSLTDQAIAQGDGEVMPDVVSDMLGLIDTNQISQLVKAILEKDKASVLSITAELSLLGADFKAALSELMSVFHQIALTQFVPEACKLETTQARLIYSWARSVPPESVQLYYQICLQGRKDIEWAQDFRMGFEMTLMRMMAFSPDDIEFSMPEFQENAVEAHTAFAEQQPATVSVSGNSPESLSESQVTQKKTENNAEPVSELAPEEAEVKSSDIAGLPEQEPELISSDDNQQTSLTQEMTELMDAAQDMTSASASLFDEAPNDESSTPDVPIEQKAAKQENIAVAENEASRLVVPQHPSAENMSDAPLSGESPYEEKSQVGGGLAVDVSAPELLKSESPESGSSESTGTANADMFSAVESSPVQSIEESAPSAEYEDYGPAGSYEQGYEQSYQQDSFYQENYQNEASAPYDAQYQESANYDSSDNLATPQSSQVSSEVADVSESKDAVGNDSGANDSGSNTASLLSLMEALNQPAPEETNSVASTNSQVDKPETNDEAEEKPTLPSENLFASADKATEASPEIQSEAPKSDFFMEATTPENQHQKTESPAPQYNDDLYQGEVLQSARQQESKQTSQQDNPWDSGADQMFSEPEPSTLPPSLHEASEQSRAPESISPNVDSMVSDTAHKSTSSYDESAPEAEESGYFSAENFLNAQSESEHQPEQAFQEQASPDQIAQGQFSQGQISQEHGAIEQSSADTEVSSDLEIPFKVNGKKVIKASQLDTWSQLIEQAGLSALTKQLALNSNYINKGDRAELIVSASQKHLLSDSAVRAIEESLSNAIKQPITVRAEIGEVIDTPAAVQKAINNMRQEHAVKTINEDSGVSDICQAFSGSVLQDTIRPR